MCPSFGRTQTGAWNAILDARRYADRFYSKRSRMNGESRRKERENEVARRKRVGKRGKQEEGDLWVEWTHTRVVCMGEGRGRATYTHMWTHVNKEESRANCETTFIPNVDSSLSPNLLLLLLPLLFFLFPPFSSYSCFFFFLKASSSEIILNEKRNFSIRVLTICGI